MSTSFTPMQFTPLAVPGMVGPAGTGNAGAMAYAAANPMGNANDEQTMQNRQAIMQGNRAAQEAVDKYNGEMNTYLLNGGAKNTYGYTAPTAPNISSFYQPALNVNQYNAGINQKYPNTPVAQQATNPSWTLPSNAFSTPAAPSSSAPAPTSTPYSHGIPQAPSGMSLGSPSAPPAAPPAAPSSTTPYGSGLPQAPSGMSLGGSPSFVPTQHNASQPTSTPYSQGIPQAPSGMGFGPVGNPAATPYGNLAGGNTAPNSQTQPTSTPGACPMSAPQFVPHSLPSASPGSGNNGASAPSSPNNAGSGAPGMPATVPGTTTTPVSGTAAGTSAADQLLALLSGGTGYLNNIASGGGAGAAINQLPAWQAMNKAMAQQNQQNYANMEAGFGALGNAPGASSDFGTSAQMYWNQVGNNQNSILAQMMLQSQQQANTNQLSASSSLGNYAQSAASQLSGQNFQNAELQSNQGFSAAQAMYQAQVNAGMLAPQLNLQTDQALANAYNQNLQTGNTLGQTQYTTQEDALNRAIQQFYQTQSQYNPTLPYQQTGAFTNPQLFYPQYQQSQLGQILGGLGIAAGSLPGIIAAISKIFSGGSGSAPGVISDGSNVPPSVAVPPSYGIPSF